ncbi:hypothetical protein M409DRAFT_71502 [Zasmidium cellare ATCC 36951]|uniref:Rab-GAP TBC domain-containing protein n=1 Tax=Zasmidium cellare ATCC 36951 TaxID=1080233 RepID=A0A6A6BYQ5_ZASCE|nr:uncharacterized protein M409DRAFT_71502 [Zasmidium cellare ATCC 36951]KAF2158712.1 hypothetical protein M409DRAFT_71502 [Zasmidium cellare ATCC 36951]
MANVSVESVNDEACIPSSPPELSYSKSSKSSSSIGSSEDLSDAGLTSKEGHFEDVALEDGGRDSGEDCNLPPDSRPTLRRPPPKSLTTSDISTLPRTRGGTSPQRSPLRALPNGSRQQRYPSLQGAVNGVLRDQSLNLPNDRSMQRAVTSPVSPFIQRASSRSPSPNKPFTQNGYSVSPQTLASATPKASHETAKESMQRRPSWQPGRKTVQELEAEYNDEDEEVPDEAILENVPISPMPGQHHSFKSPTTMSVRSATPSPHRRSPHANLHSANIPKQAKRPSLPTGHYNSPRSPRHGRPQTMPHSNTVSAFSAGEPLSLKHRSKSWTEDLNQEARQLSQALEEYAEKVSIEKRHSGSNTPSSSPPRPALTKSATTTSIKEVPSLPTVPPVQKGNIMIDPLPISKEKEAVLTRTRPSWLPPKSQKEERKHLREFQQMMARAAEAEKKRALKEQASRENREEMQGSIARIWDQHVIPNWEAVVKEPRTRELWWRGVTPRSRGEVWQKAVGNELELSATSFEAALARANDLEEKIAEMPDEERSHSKEAAWLDAIDRDVPNVYPELRMYQHDAPLHRSLTNVLRAFAMYRSDVGYVYGTHLIAGVICLHLHPPQAFVLLANMLNRPLPLAFLVHNQVAMARTYKYCLSTLKYKFTRLHDHLTNPAIGLAPEEFLDPMFRCLFAYHLSHEHVSRIIDVFVFEGDKTLVRAAVACLGRLESKLYGSKEEILSLVGWQNEERWDVGKEDDFLDAVREAGKVDAMRSRERLPSTGAMAVTAEPVAVA